MFHIIHEFLGSHILKKKKGSHILPNILFEKEKEKEKEQNLT